MDLTAYAPTRMGLMKMLRVMKLTASILLIAGLQVSATGKAQSITLSVKDAPLQKVLQSIEKQTGYLFWYNNALLQKAKTVNLELKNATLEHALQACFRNQPLTYTIVNKTIVVKLKTPQQIVETQVLSAEVRGRIINEKGEPIAGATISVKGTQQATASNADGEFMLSGLIPNATITVSSVGYESQEINIDGKPELLIQLKQSISKLDEVKIIGYGTTTQRLNTGKVSKINAEEISRQPVTNPLLALQGRIPGMNIQSNSGIPGANMVVQIRGINSIAAGSTPLYVINGVPFTETSLDLISITSSTGVTSGLSPFNSINPADIESIEVLKDADATAIYGSRGANGVVLITTKTGKAGKTKFSVNFYSGAGQVPRFVDMLNTEEYLQLRKMAFANDGIIPTPVNAPDIFVWDSTKNTNWQEKLIGGTAKINDIQVSLSGGNAKTRFLLGGSYRHTGSVFSKDANDDRVTGHLNLNHNSENNKLAANISINYSIDKNNLVSDPTHLSNLPPNYPIYDSLGDIVWRPGITEETFSILSRRFNNTTKTFISNASIQYRLAAGLNIKASLGYTASDLQQMQLFPGKTSNPVSSQAGASYFGDNHNYTWIAEPQLTYKNKLGIGILDILIGTTFQRSISEGKLIYAQDYSSDAFLENVALAGSVNFYNNNYIRYSYNSLFGRINYNIQNRYILNTSFRRDGSSRFGPGKKFGNFGAIGAAWIFSEGKFINIPFLTYGKLRASYGITGNDQIADYQYLSTYIATSNNYQVPGIRPSRLANANYNWETNKKIEVALEVNMLNDRLSFTVSYYRNRSGNQLVSYPLPSQTGFSGYQANLPALVENTGLEATLYSANIKSKRFSWSTAINITTASNKLLEFPNLEATSYGTTNLVIQEPLQLVWGYKYLGVDPQTGLTIVKDFDNNGTYSSPADYTFFGTRLPDIYGGLNNSFDYKNWHVEFTFQFVKQKKPNIERAWINTPGTIYNQYSGIWNSIWKKAGDQSRIPRPSTSGAGITSFRNYYLSDATYSDASYIKLNNLSVSYQFRDSWIKKSKIESLRLFIQCQNLFTITSYKGFDPEAATATSLPNLRIITAGINCEF